MASLREPSRLSDRYAQLDPGMASANLANPDEVVRAAKEATRETIASRDRYGIPAGPQQTDSCPESDQRDH